MGCISVHQLKQGMALAEDVRDVNSRLLLPKGGEIQEQHIRMLKMWGIAEVDIVGDHDGDIGCGSENDPALLKEVAYQLQHHFKFNDLAHPLVKELFTLSVYHRAKEGIGSDHQKVSNPAGMDNKGAAADIRADIRKKNIILPEIPSIVYELNEVTADPLTSADDIARVVSKSASLSSLILKIVNSAFYGFPSKIDNISRAVALIGSKEISALGMGITTMKLFKDIPQEIVDLKQFFKHSLACGVLSRILAAYMNVQHTEQLFVAGLLHDIGRVIIFKYFAHQSKASLFEALNSGDLLYNTESRHLGCRHTHIGKDLFHKWKLPYSLENSTYYHHRPSAAPDPTQPSIVHLADICAHGYGLGASGETYVPSLDQAAVEDLRLAPGVLKNVMNQALRQLNFLETVLQDEG